MDNLLGALSGSLNGKLGGPTLVVDSWLVQEVGPKHRAPQIELQGLTAAKTHLGGDRSLASPLSASQGAIGILVAGPV